MFDQKERAMTQVRNINQAYELDPRSGAFVNDTLAGLDGSVLGANTVPEPSDDAGGRRSYALTSVTRLRERGLWGAAAVGGGLLVLGMAYLGTRLWATPQRSFVSSLMRRRSRRWGFGR
jgi:hypothetical protein